MHVQFTYKIINYCVILDSLHVTSSFQFLKTFFFSEWASCAMLLDFFLGDHFPEYVNFLALRRARENPQQSPGMSRFSRWATNSNKIINYDQ